MSEWSAVVAALLAVGVFGAGLGVGFALKQRQRLAELLDLSRRLEAEGQRRAGAEKRLETVAKEQNDLLMLTDSLKQQVAMNVRKLQGRRRGRK